mmetsp:Transcript_28748/g.73164  ORF Transcript_28748/g.73164 Transcript_28748/m.73164 type:complete len:289 (-) Transcript_28748:761-1627(-)
MARWPAVTGDAVDTVCMTSAYGTGTVPGYVHSTDHRSIQSCAPSLYTNHAMHSTEEQSPVVQVPAIIYAPGNGQRQQGAQQRTDAAPSTLAHAPPSQQGHQAPLVRLQAASTSGCPLALLVLGLVMFAACAWLLPTMALIRPSSVTGRLFWEDDAARTYASAACAMATPWMELGREERGESGSWPQPAMNAWLADVSGQGAGGVLGPGSVHAACCASLLTTVAVLSSCSTTSAPAVSMSAPRDVTRTRPRSGSASSCSMSVNVDRSCATSVLPRSGPTSDLSRPSRSE